MVQLLDHWESLLNHDHSYHSLTESEVIIGKSQTEAYQYIDQAISSRLRSDISL